MSSFSEEEIFAICQQIFTNLQIGFELDDLSVLLEEKIYIELYRIMFPYLEEFLSKIENRNIKKAEKIQSLIDLLSKEVLNLDLSHIKGEKIAKGDKKHILNFLQLLLEMSRLSLPTGGQKEVNGKGHGIRSAPISYSDEESNKNSIRRHTVQGLEDEFPFDMMQAQMENEEMEEGNGAEEPHFANSSEKNKGSPKQEEEDHEFDFHDPNDPNEEENYENEEFMPESSKNVIREVSKSEESSRNEKSSGNKNKKSVQKGKENVPSQKSRDSEKRDVNMGRQAQQNLAENLYLLKETQKKELGKTLFAKKTIGTRILTSKPKKKDSFAKIKKSSFQKAKELQEESENEENPEEQEPRSDLEPNVYEIITENISRIRQSLKGMRDRKLNVNELKTQQHLIREKNQYKQLLKEFLRDHQIVESKTAVQAEKMKKSYAKRVRAIQNLDKNFEEVMENEELGMYYKLQNDEIRYMNKIHRIIFELEKRKIIDENSKYKEQCQTREQETRNILESIENQYKDRISLMKEKLLLQRKEQVVSALARKQLLSKLEKELRDEKKRQLQEMKEAWRCEKEKFDMFVMDDGVLEQKILDLYK